MDIEKARRLHTVIAAGRKLVDDKTASIAPELFGRMTYEEREPDFEIPLISAGTRINWNGVLMRAAVDLWDTESNNPDNAPNLWAGLDYKDGYRMIPSVITVTTAFAKDECGWWDGVLYRSKVDANVYTPAIYPDNWEEVVSG